MKRASEWLRNWINSLGVECRGITREMDPSTHIVNIYSVISVLVQCTYKALSAQMKMQLVVGPCQQRWEHNVHSRSNTHTASQCTFYILVLSLLSLIEALLCFLPLLLLHLADHLLEDLVGGSFRGTGQVWGLQSTRNDPRMLCSPMNDMPSCL